MTCSPALPPLVALAAGGTGGHVFPAEALARELLGRGLRVILVTDKRGSRFSEDLSVPTYRVASSALGRGWFKTIRSVAVMGVGVVQAHFLLRKLRPVAVVGFGGYPSVPTLYAALRLGIPIALHEANAVLGRANAALAGKARLLAMGFPKTARVPPTTARCVVTGNPVRPVFATLRACPYAPPAEEGPLRLFVVGGSQGAHVFSRVVPRAVALLPTPLRQRLIVTQQCRTDDLELARTGFAGGGVEAELLPFFHDMPERMADAHLILCRSGGSTVAELAALGRPAVLVPLPHSHAGEQTANAEALAEAGGAWLIPEEALTPEALAVRLEALLTMPSTLARAAASARAWGTANAADALANALLESLDLQSAHVLP